MATTGFGNVYHNENMGWLDRYEVNIYGTGGDTLCEVCETVLCSFESECPSCGHIKEDLEDEDV